MVISPTPLQTQHKARGSKPRDPIIVITELGRLTLYAFPAHQLLYSADPRQLPAGAASGPKRRGKADGLEARLVTDFDLDDPSTSCMGRDRL